MKSTHSAAYKRFRAKLLAAREQRGMTQDAVAKALGTHRSRISRMESGERRVDVIELVALARIYRKPLSYFVDE